MRLLSGQKVPSFSIRDFENNIITEEDLRGKKTLLSFYRYVSCPFCNLRIHRLLEHYSSYESNGLQIIGVFESPAESMAKLIDKQAISFPIIPDPKLELYKLFGVRPSVWSFIKGCFDVKNFSSAMSKGFLPGKIEGALTMMPADFLIDENLNCEVAYYGSYISDHLDFSQIDSKINKDNF